jgi:hypothetical protein
VRSMSGGNQQKAIVAREISMGQFPDDLRPADPGAGHRRHQDDP